MSFSVVPDTNRKPIVRQTVRDPKSARQQNVTGYALTAAVVAAGAPQTPSKYSNPWFVAKPVHLGSLYAELVPNAN